MSALKKTEPDLVCSPKSHKFPKSARLLKRCQFVEMANRRNKLDLKISVGSFLIVGQANNLGRHRLGITVTKKIGPAVTRNYLKRMVREFFRKNQAQWPGSWDLVFIAGSKAGSLPKNHLTDDLDRAERKLHQLPVANREKVTACQAATSDGSVSSHQKTTSCEKHPETQGVPTPHVTSPTQKILAAPKYLALLAIGFYRRFISPMLPPSCRFWPTCSAYATEAFTTHGFWWGGWLTTRRLLKCHPLHAGGYDPVPKCRTTPRAKTDKPRGGCDHTK